MDKKNRVTVYFSSRGVSGFVTGVLSNIGNSMNVEIESAKARITIFGKETKDVEFQAPKVVIRGSNVIMIVYETNY